MSLVFPAPAPRPFSFSCTWALLGLAASQAGACGASLATTSPSTTMSHRTTAASCLPAPVSSGETIILLHGLGRTRLSMSWLARRFELAGYTVVNVGYPSTRLSVAEAAEHLHAKVAPHLGADTGRVHFVTHSLGGIIVRALLKNHRPPQLGRVVMLGPPNQGSEVADRLARNPAYRWATGPAGQELGTQPSSTPNQLGPVDYEVGVIAGRASLNPLFSSWMKGANDGKVSVARAAVPGLRDLLVIDRSHTFLMRSREVAAQALHFIAYGQFLQPKQAQRPPTSPSSRSRSTSPT